MIKCGVDLVYIPDFERRARRGREGVLKKIFLESELKNTEIAHLAGVFAAKEAVMKALDLPVGRWNKIEVVYRKSGKPKIKVEGDEIKGSDLSVAHVKDYAIAIFLAEVSATRVGGSH